MMLVEEIRGHWDEQAAGATYRYAIWLVCNLHVGLFMVHTFLVTV